MKVRYDDGMPMSHAEVKIFSPGDGKIEYQSGCADKNGCFVFFPDEAGEWTMMVNDGMGHGVVTKVDVKEAMKVESTAKGWPRWQKLTTGISIIWGLTALIFYLKVRKKIA